jgi:hypothetical protein
MFAEAKTSGVSPPSMASRNRPEGPNLAVTGTP